MVNRMRPGADRALKDGRRRELYTDCAAASNQRDPRLDASLHPFCVRVPVRRGPCSARPVIARSWVCTGCNREINRIRGSDVIAT